MSAIENIVLELSCTNQLTLKGIKEMMNSNGKKMLGINGDISLSFIDDIDSDPNNFWNNVSISVRNDKPKIPKNLVLCKRDKSQT